MKHVRGPLLAAVGATTVLLLSACASETAGTAVQSTSTAPITAATSAVSPSASTGATASSASLPKAASGDVTKPGSELKVGDRAVVPFKYGTDKNGTIAITVTAIEKGENADLAKYGDKAKGLIPYYIRVSIENVDGSDLAYSSVSLRAIGTDGKSTGVIITGETDKCESETAKKDFTTAGAKYETCVLQASREGLEVAGATFDKGDDYLKSPITWKS
ncbi:hypothetical protein ACFFQW_02490 [Umezawaea endophytica]|uniref:Lipoprotein n=1 Tax=Umezawaea endophytica TaxID=1654476 RepID=A0A9X3AJT4_9PSEU|nr:hypothetical protein [Umezawaea endophytica]MCS7481965.1 hypothetical protein [Umezawaea endophytica]